MENYREVSPQEKDDWDRLVNHPLQSWGWGNFREQRQKVTRLGKYDHGQLVKVFLIMWTRVARTPWYFGYIPMGSVPDSGDLDALRRVGKTKRAIGIRIEPVTQRDRLEEKEKDILNRLPKGRHLFKPKTFWIHLTGSEEDILGRMHSKARYNIRLAHKKGVRIEADTQGGCLEEYLNLMFEGTAKRQKFYAHSRSYHAAMWNTLSKTGTALFLKAMYQEKPLAIWMLFVWKKGLYYAYGAFGEEHKEVMAPTLLMWESIKLGKKRGCEFFDLWGAEEGKGFSRFKEQFGPTLVETAGTYDLAIHEWHYKAFRLAEEVRWKLLRILK